MNSKPNTLLNELIESQVEELIQSDDFYQKLATPLKSASVIKQEHRQQLTEFLQFKEQIARLDQAQKLITDLMPSFIPPVEFDKIKQELDNSGAHFSDFMEKAEDSDRPILLQEMFGLSDETLMHVFALGKDLIEKGHFQDACSLFAFLTTLAPHVPSYWILEGVCFENLNLHEETKAAFTAANFLKENTLA